MRLAPLTLALSLSLATIPAALAQDAPAVAGNGTPVTLTQAMADPDWIGPPVEQRWWRWDGSARAVPAQARRRDHPRHLRRCRSPAAHRATLDGADARATWTPPTRCSMHTRTRMAFVRNGDVFVRDLRSGALTQVTRTEAAESRPQWSRDGALVFRAGNDWFQLARRPAASSQAAIVKAEDDPAKPPKADDAARPPAAPDRDPAHRARPPRRGARAERSLAQVPTRPAPPARSTWATRSRSSTARCRRTAAGCWWSPRQKGADDRHRRQDAASTSPNRATRNSRTCAPASAATRRCRRRCGWSTSPAARCAS